MLLNMAENIFWFIITVAVIGVLSSFSYFVLSVSIDLFRKRK